jgi:Fe-S-cluster-containing dehydrogenase component
MHCESPACAEVCKVGAITKREEDGIVVVDTDKCNGCRECSDACPFDVPQFGAGGKLQKCDYCTGLGTEPACTASCPADALSYGKIMELLEMAAKKGKKVRKLDGKTGPSIVIVH